MTSAEEEENSNMADTGEWELVTKSNKKGKYASGVKGKLSKDEKREFFQKAPRAPFTVGIDTSPIGKENRKPKSPKANAEPKKKVEKKSNSGTQQPRNLDEAIGRLSVGEMQSLLDVVMSRFIDSPLIWLKDLASYLNVRVNPVKHPDPTFKGQELSYPTSRLAVKVKKLLLSTLARCSDSVLASFHKHCITSMVQEQIKGFSVAGYKLFIQILSIHRPHVGIVNLQSYCELRQTIQNQTPSCLSLLWAIGQSGIDDFAIGLKVWMQLMVPLIGLKNYSAYVVEYGSDVFSGGGGGGTQDCGDVLGVREFFSILDFTWCSSGSLPKPVQRQLYALYPKVKTTAFSSTPELVLRNYFPSFLRRLNPEASSAMRTELRTCLVQCLTQDLHCWNVWSQLYVKHLPQSAILLNHLGSEVSIVSQSLRVNRTEVQNTLKSFADTNTQMAHKVDSVAGLREATDATERLLSQLQKVKSSSSASVSRFWSIMVTVLVMAVIWDIKNAGTFYGSKLGWALERAGLIPYFEAFGKSVQLATIQAYRWCIFNVPFYYSKGCDLAEPYLLLVWNRLEGTVAYCWTGIESAVQYLPVIKDNIKERVPGLSAAVSYYGSAALDGVWTVSTKMMDVAVPYISQVHHFLSTKVFVGALAPENLQQYVMRSMEYISHVLWKIHSTLLGDLEEYTDNISSKAS